MAYTRAHPAPCTPGRRRAEEPPPRAAPLPSSFVSVFARPRALFALRVPLFDPLGRALEGRRRGKGGGSARPFQRDHPSLLLSPPPSTYQRAVRFTVHFTLGLLPSLLRDAAVKLVVLCVAVPRLVGGGEAGVVGRGGDRDVGGGGVGGLVLLEGRVDLQGRRKGRLGGGGRARGAARRSPRLQERPPATQARRGRRAAAGRRGAAARRGPQSGRAAAAAARPAGGQRRALTARRA